EEGRRGLWGGEGGVRGGDRDGFVYYVFDLLHLDGRDLARLPLAERKAELARLIGKGRGPIRYSEHFEGDGAVVLRHACQISLEGIVSKRMDEPYRSGRSESFIKIKCSNARGRCVGGFPPRTALAGGGRRVGVGLLRGRTTDLCRRGRPRLHTRGSTRPVAAAAPA